LENKKTLKNVKDATNIKNVKKRFYIYGFVHKTTEMHTLCNSVDKINKTD